MLDKVIDYILGEMDKCKEHDIRYYALGEIYHIIRIEEKRGDGVDKS